MALKKAPSGGLRTSHNEGQFLNTLSLSASEFLEARFYRGNSASYCSPCNSVSWTQLAVAIIIFLAFIAPLIYLWVIKEKRKKSQSRDGKENRIIIQYKLIAENDALRARIDELIAENEFLEARFYRADVILDPRTAHPKLKVSEDGKSVWNTGNVSKVSDWEERFDSHTFILAKRGFLEGKHYWEVEIGQNKPWALGVASVTASRKGNITLSPENGYWVMRYDDGKAHWASTEQWTRLKVNGKLTKLGIFLDKSAGNLSFYDAYSKRKLHTYKTLGFGKLYPFFSTRSVTAELDCFPLRILPWNLQE